jgi:uncharacterized protein (TIGR02145 family)
MATVSGVSKTINKKMHIIHKTWIITLMIVPLYGCEFDSSPATDVTGQIGTLIDIDGNKYNTIGIGTQIWMQENLKVTHLADGSKITLLEQNTDWLNRNLNIAAYCWYDNDSINNKTTYGGLYNFFTVETGLICPTGWHVPSQAEWKTLVDYLGGKEVAGGKLKDYIGNYWTSPNHCIENNFRFVGLPGGYRTSRTGLFNGKGYGGSWWENRISKEDSLMALKLSVTNSEHMVYESYFLKNEGASIRCVKDETNKNR